MGYYAIIHYYKNNGGLFSLLDTYLVGSGGYEVRNEFNFNDNYGDYY
jgi:hypothetical protein